MMFLPDTRSRLLEGDDEAARRFSTPAPLRIREEGDPGEKVRRGDVEIAAAASSSW
jgi:hypothetical protein